MTLCRGVRGATTADSNTRDDILAATRQLLALMIRLNGIESEHVASAMFSLTRDLDRLVAANYRVEQIQPFDMFPQTEEVETLVLLRKNDATANQSLHGYEDAASESKSR